MPEQTAQGHGRKPCVVGITGAAGSGKSTVARMLSALGAQTVDADALVRWTYRDPVFIRRLAARFGPAILGADGEVNRAAVAQVVFQDAAALADLEHLVHPAVIHQIIEVIQAYREDPDRAPLLAVEIPLLYEAGAEALVDRVLVVTAPAEARAERLRERGWDAERIAGVDRSQMSEADKAARADDVLDTAGGLEDTAARVEALWGRLVQ